MSRRAALVLIFLLAFGGEDAFAEQTSRHWLIGGWEERSSGAVLKVAGVEPDGTALGTMGGDVDAQRKAAIKVAGARVRIVSASGGIVELTLTSHDEMRGTLTQSGGAVTQVALTRMQPCAGDPSLREEQPYGPPVYCAGDTWTFTGGRVQKVVKVDTDTVVMTGYPMLGGTPCPGCRFELSRDLTLRVIRQPDGAVPSVAKGFWPMGEGWRFWDFPLATGKRWRASGKAFRDNLPWVYTVDCEVQGFEDVTTPAGSLKAFRVYRTFRWQHSILGQGESIDTMWFAPAAKTIVKLRSDPINWEIVSFRLGDFATTHVRQWLDETALRAKGLQPMTQRALEERYSRPVTSRTENHLGFRGTTWFKPGGSVRRDAVVDESGTWKIKDGMLCTSFQRIRQGADECRALYRTGDGEYAYFISSPQIIGVFFDLD